MVGRRMDTYTRRRDGELYFMYYWITIGLWLGELECSLRRGPPHPIERWYTENLWSLD